MTATPEPDTRTIHERMVAILSDLPPIGKDQKNVQQNFMFRGHDDVLNALNPLFAKHGVFVTPTVLGREISQRTTAGGKAMFEVSLLVEYSFHGLAGDCVRASSWGEGTDMGDKATSKAMTMAFKSVLNQAFAISNKEIADPDALTAEETVKVAPAAAQPKNTGAASAPPQAAQQEPQPVIRNPSGERRSDPQANKLRAQLRTLIAADAMTEAAFLKAAHGLDVSASTVAECLDRLTKSQASNLIDRLEKLEESVKAQAAA